MGWELQLAPGLEGSRLLHVESWCWQGPAICGAWKALECKSLEARPELLPQGLAVGLVAAGRGG